MTKIEDTFPPSTTQPPPSGSGQTWFSWLTLGYLDATPLPPTEVIKSERIDATQNVLQLQKEMRIQEFFYASLQENHVDLYQILEQKDALQKELTFFFNGRKPTTKEIDQFINQYNIDRKGDLLEQIRAMKPKDDLQNDFGIFLQGDYNIDHLFLIFKEKEELQQALSVFFDGRHPATITVKEIYAWISSVNSHYPDHAIDWTQESLLEEVLASKEEMIEKGHEIAKTFPLSIVHRERNAALSKYRNQQMAFEAFLLTMFRLSVSEF